MNEQKINRGTHGDSLLILVSLETLSKKPPLQAWNAKWWEHVTEGSTDCNIPLSMGIPSICIGVYNGHGSHTREEFVEKESLKAGLMIAAHFIESLIE